MAKRSGRAKKKAPGSGPRMPVGPESILGLMEDVRQASVEPAHRISPPGRRFRPTKVITEAVVAAPKPRKTERAESDMIAALPALAELANCIWYVKTRHFKREWQDENATDDDPRTRRTLGRLNKGADALKKLGLEVEDPTGKRYPTGGEAMMRPIDIVPTQGLTYDMVTEATTPLIYWKGAVVQRAEVFVATPMPAPQEDVQTADSGGAANEATPAAGNDEVNNPSDSKEGTGESA